MTFEPAILERYDRPGPRYTSYPTAVEFRSDVDRGALAERYARLGAEGRDVALYVHLPFCAQRCHYCACNVVIAPRREKVSAPYLERLAREAELVRQATGGPVRVAQLHLGGGTPTYHSPAELDALLTHLEETFVVEPNAERSVELDPRVTTPEHLECFARHGFRRVSIGVQDTSPRVQKSIGRVQPVETSAACIRTARALGFESVNVDLIYGLPHQSPATLRRTVETCLSWGVDRFAVYSFAWVPKGRAHQRRIPEDALPSAREKLELLAAVHEAMEEGGHVAIGIDHFARPDDELAVAQRAGRLHRNFMGYTVRQCPDMIGLGLSSIGNVDGAFVQNEKKLSRYLAALDAGELPIERGVCLSTDDRVRSHVIRELMCNFRVDKRAVESAYGVCFDRYFAGALERLAEYEKDGLASADGAEVRATGQGRYIARNLAMCFDAYRGPNAASSGFSRTV